MTADEKQGAQQQEFKVPLDMVPDILGLIVSHRLAHAITEAGGDKWFIRVLVHFDSSTERHRAAVSQIERLLDIFNDYRNANYEEMNWR